MKKLLISCVLIIVTLTSCSLSTTDVFKSNWNINIPGGYNELYSNMLESVFGDGPRYTVLEYKDNKSIENLYKWKTPTKNMIKETKEIIKDLEYNSGEKVSENLIPDFKSLKIWVRTKYFPEGQREKYIDEFVGDNDKYLKNKDFDIYDNIFIFYDKSSKRLYIAESL